MSDNIPYTPLQVVKPVPKRRPKGVQHLAQELEEDLRRAAELAEESHAPSTRRFYRSDVRCWMEYAEKRGLQVFPILPPHLATYIAFMQRQGLNVRTIRRRCSAFTQWHGGRGEVSPTAHPTVKRVMRGLTRKHAKPAKRKRALTAEMVVQILALDVSLRDRAILLVGITTGMRRAELAAMTWEDIEETPEGWIVHIPTSKTDKEGEGQTVALPHDRSLPRHLCPVRTLEEWWNESEGPTVFSCAPKTISRIVKRHVAAIGLNANEFGGHSFRVGFATESKRAGASVDDIMRQTRHRSDRIARGYIETIEKSTNPAVLGVLQRLKESATKHGS